MISLGATSPQGGREMEKRIVGELRRTADRVIELTVEEGRALPGMLGRIVPPMLIHHGYYTATVDGAKTLYVRKPS